MLKLHTWNHNHSFAIVGSRAGIEADMYSNEPLIKQLPSQDLQCRTVFVLFDKLVFWWRVTQAGTSVG